MKIGILVDNWKVPIFRAKLTKAGFVVKTAKDRTIPKEVTAMFVVTDETARLEMVVKACHFACKASQN